MELLPECQSWKVTHRSDVQVPILILTGEEARPQEGRGLPRPPQLVSGEAGRRPPVTLATCQAAPLPSHGITLPTGYFPRIHWDRF